MPIAHINLFPNALLNLFQAICWQVHPLLTSPGIKMKGWKGEKVKGGRHYIKSKKQVMQYTYPFIGICWVSPLELLSSLLIKPLSGYAAHLSPCKGEKERGLLILNWRIYFYFIIVALAIFYPFTFSLFHLISYFQFVTFLTFENISRFLFSLQITFSI